MTFTQEELRRLATRDSDWRSLWERMWVALEEHLHKMILFGAPADEASWALKPAFSMLCDTHSAQDFIMEFICDLHRKAEAGTLLVDFEGVPERVLNYLASRDIVQKRALSHAGREARVGIGGMPGDRAHAPSVHPLETEDGGFVHDLVDGDSRVRREGFISAEPIQIDWDPDTGIDAKIRMAALQCWPRLCSEQLGRDLLRADLVSHVHVEPGVDPIEYLQLRHASAVARIRERLEAILQEILDAPGMHAPTRDRLDRQRVGLEVELLLVPLDRGDIRDLLALKTDDAAYQQVSRYRKAFKSLFPALRALLEEVAAAT